MNFNEKSLQKKLFRLPYTSPQLLHLMSEKIISWLPTSPREYVIVCIGTDRSTGDSLGPLTGTYLNELKPRHISIYGTLHYPVHATNLDTYVKKIHKLHHNPYIIAIDACLGKTSSVGDIISGIGPIQPGAALNKPLALIGDVHITGVVNISGFMEYAVLQNTRLSIVSDLAKNIAHIINMIDERLTYERATPTVLLQQ